MKRIILLLVFLYRLIISPLKPYNSCRFYPTCSAYSYEVFSKHGIIKGSILCVKRICKCHPWHKGGIDLPPE